jgi:hypothetical protein
VFVVQETRIVSNDWVVRYRNRWLQLTPLSSRMPARSTVQVCEAGGGRTPRVHRSLQDHRAVSHSLHKAFNLATMGTFLTSFDILDLVA